MVNTTWFFIVLLNFSIESGETCRKSWETAAFKKEIIINKRYVIKSINGKTKKWGFIFLLLLFKC